MLYSGIPIKTLIHTAAVENASFRHEHWHKLQLIINMAAQQAFVTLWPLAEWPYGPIFLFQEFWEFDQDITFFDFETKSSVSIFFLVLKQDPLLIKYPTLKVREHLTSLPPLSPHKNLDSLLVSSRPFPRLS